MMVQMCVGMAGALKSVRMVRHSQSPTVQFGDRRLGKLSFRQGLLERRKIWVCSDRSVPPLEMGCMRWSLNRPPRSVQIEVHVGLSLTVVMVIVGGGRCTATALLLAFRSVSAAAAATAAPSASSSEPKKREWETSREATRHGAATVYGW